MNLNGTKKSIRGKIKNPKIDPNSTHEVRSEINETLKTQSKYNVEVYVQVSMLYVVLVNHKTAGYHRLVFLLGIYNSCTCMYRHPR